MSVLDRRGGREGGREMGMLVASGIWDCLHFYVGCAEQALLPG